MAKYTKVVIEDKNTRNQRIYGSNKTIEEIDKLIDEKYKKLSKIPLKWVYIDGDGNEIGEPIYVYLPEYKIQDKLMTK